MRKTCAGVGGDFKTQVPVLWLRQACRGTFASSLYRVKGGTKGEADSQYNETVSRPASLSPADVRDTMAQPAAVREPSDADVAGFRDLADVFTWAKIKGRLECPGSHAGSLLRLVAAADWAECAIEDMASVSPENFERILGERAFCGDYGDELPDEELPDADAAIAE